MKDSRQPISRRLFATSAAGGIVAMSSATAFGSSFQEQAEKEQEERPERKPREAEFSRDYPEPGFKPSWKNKQINRTMAQDFVIYAHSDLEMTKKLFDREPGLINAAIDWGAGDWETAIGGASHMGQKEIVKFLLSKGARPDIFCATMMGMLDTVKQWLNLEPALIDAKGPHGFDLWFHAQVGQEDAKAVLDHLQSIKEKKLRPIPFLKKKQKRN